MMLHRKVFTFGAPIAGSRKRVTSRFVFLGSNQAPSIVKGEKDLLGDLERFLRRRVFGPGLPGLLLWVMLWNILRG